MPTHSSDSGAPPPVTLVVRKTIHATRERLFDAWTRPEELKKWWGPQSVTCTDASVELTPGGSYRLANLFPNGDLVWISGEFEVIDRPHRLVYTWRVSPSAIDGTVIDAGAGPTERVTVTFEPRGANTEVTITHERIPSIPVRTVHEQGWHGCLDKLAEYVSA